MARLRPLSLPMMPALFYRLNGFIIYMFFEYLLAFPLSVALVQSSILRIQNLQLCTVLLKYYSSILWISTRPLTSDFLDVFSIRTSVLIQICRLRIKLCCCCSPTTHQPFFYSFWDVIVHFALPRYLDARVGKHITKTVFYIFHQTRVFLSSVSVGKPQIMSCEMAQSGK